MTHFFFEISPSDAFQAKKENSGENLLALLLLPFSPPLFPRTDSCASRRRRRQSSAAAIYFVTFPQTATRKGKKKRNCLTFLFTWLAHTTAQYSTAYAGNSAGEKRNVWESGVRRGRRKFSPPPPFFMRSCRTRENGARGNERNGFFFANFLPPSAKFPKSLLWFFFDGHTTDSHKKIDKRSVPRRCLARFFLGRCFEITNTCWLSFFQAALSLQFPAFFLNFFF